MITVHPSHISLSLSAAASAQPRGCSCRGSTSRYKVPHPAPSLLSLARAHFCTCDGACCMFDYVARSLSRIPLCPQVYQFIHAPVSYDHAVMILLSCLWYSSIIISAICHHVLFMQQTRLTACLLHSVHSSGCNGKEERRQGSSSHKGTHASWSHGWLCGGGTVATTPGQRGQRRLGMGTTGTDPTSRGAASKPFGRWRQPEATGPAASKPFGRWRRPETTTGPATRKPFGRWWRGPGGWQGGPRI